MLVESLKADVATKEAENAALRAGLEEAVKALEKYARLYEDGKCWNWVQYACDKFSGGMSHFDWPGEDQDEPWEYAERALAKLKTLAQHEPAEREER